MDIPKGTWADVQEEDSILSSCGTVCDEDFLRAFDVMIPWLIRLTGVEVPPARGRFVTDFRRVETNLIFARQIELPDLVVFALQRRDVRIVRNHGIRL